MAIAFRSTLGVGGIEVDSLTITSAATKTSYLEGETLDITGLVVTATAGLLSGNVTSECVITPQVLDTPGTQTITIAYGGQTVTYDVTVAAITLSITTQPTKTDYIQGETLDLTGIVVTASATGYTEDVTADCTFSPANGSTLSTAGTITITAANGATLSSVTIGSGMATSIAYTIGSSTTKSTKASLAKNGKYTVNDINATSITFYCMGTTSSARLYVNYLSVTYNQ